MYIATKSNELQNSPEFFSPRHFSPDITLQQKIILEQNSPGHYHSPAKSENSPRILLSQGQNSPGTNFSRYKIAPAGKPPGRNISQDKTLPFQDKCIVEIGNFNTWYKTLPYGLLPIFTQGQNSPVWSKWSNYTWYKTLPFIISPNFT